MFLTWLERAAVALSITTVLANVEFARAAEQNITPIAGTECQAMARKISQSVGIQLSTRVGGPDFVADFLRGVQGNVCLMSGRATGLNTSFDKVRDQLNAVLSDWTPVPDIYLDDVAATAGGGREGSAARHICT